LRTTGASMPFVLSLPSGLSIPEPLQRLSAFCGEEYPYYDGVEDDHPDRVDPVDVMVTIAVNSRISQAEQVRAIHRGLAAACDPLLPRIPHDADLLAFDTELEQFRILLHAAVQNRGVLTAVATKILHRKRRNFIPMLDNVVLKHYLTACGRPTWLDNQAQNGKTAAAAAVLAAEMFRRDLRAVRSDIEALRATLAGSGFPLTPVRVLEILVWTEIEVKGYYRPVGSRAASSRRT
jgi:hypothetical protein